MRDANLNDFEFNIRGHTWQVCFVTRRQMPKRIWGLCLRDKKKILVRKDLSRKNVLDTLIHEVRHAQHEVMFEAEEYIDWTSTNIAEAIEKSGLLGL
ncbi:MAG: hypothetical protein KatS3mg109_0115 [Pirellulaceae bacterium]|nr:MAG: hypothetical protein KatS3mg109_0115 [Pirellulaceae bacterium]